MEAVHEAHWSEVVVVFFQILALFVSEAGRATFRFTGPFSTDTTMSARMLLP